MENYDLIAITETWRDGLHSWNTAMEGYELSRRDRQVKRGQKRQAKESVPPLINEKGEVATRDMEKTEVLTESFASLFIDSQDSHISPIPETLGWNWGNKLTSAVRAE